MNRQATIRTEAVIERCRMVERARPFFDRSVRQLRDPSRPLVGRERIERDGRLFLVLEWRDARCRIARLMAVEVIGADRLRIWMYGSVGSFHDRLRRRIDADECGAAAASWVHPSFLRR